MIRRIFAINFVLFVSLLGLLSAGFYDQAIAQQASETVSGNNVVKELAAEEVGKPLGIGGVCALEKQLGFVFRRLGLRGLISADAPRDCLEFSGIEWRIAFGCILCRQSCEDRLLRQPASAHAARDRGQRIIA